MTLVALLVVLAGFALMLGAKPFAESALKGAVWIAAALSFVSCLLARCDATARSATMPGIPTSWVTIGLTICVLALIGYVSWRRRADRDRRRDAQQRRHGGARERELPAPPPEGAEHDP